MGLRDVRFLSYFDTVMNSTDSTSNASPNDAIWRTTRHGAWAARGFHYQHLVTTLILIRQWAGLSPRGYVTPEGEEDAVIETATGITLVQAKSRHERSFSKSEVDEILTKVTNIAADISSPQDVRTAVVVEQPVRDVDSVGIEQLFESESSNVVVCPSPEEDILSILHQCLNLSSPKTADTLLKEIYGLVVEASTANASTSRKNRRQISTTDVERRLLERIEAIDASAIDKAHSEGVVLPVDFETPIKEPGFYLGVKVKPGHVASGLTFDRSNDVETVINALRDKRHVLLTGPSGAGKSALTWLSARRMTNEMRWFEVTSMATPSTVNDVIRFIRSRKPTERSPVAIVMDDVSNDGINVWNILASELQAIPNVFTLGSIRNEDKHEIANHADTEFIPVSLNGDLAETIWEKLHARQETQWTHWQEPFEQSNNLLLEYVHILTSGRRLSEVIGDQVLQREREQRDAELAIIRLTATLASHGGEAIASRIFQKLGLNSGEASRAMRRLLDEHLVVETRPVVIGGLHPLRSTALLHASHDDAVHLRVESLEACLSVATAETLPRVLQSILVDQHEDERETVLHALSEILLQNDDLDVWTSVLTGLGRATLESHITSLTERLEKHEIPRTHWATASLIYFADTDIRKLSKSRLVVELHSAIKDFKKAEKEDLRTECLQEVLNCRDLPICNSLEQGNRLLSALAPICDVGPEIPTLILSSKAKAESNIKEIAPFLATAYAIDPDLARNLLDQLGGRPNLLKLFRSQIPWTTNPILKQDGKHGVTVQCDWFFIGEPYQQDPHDAILEICKILLAISPDIDAVASDAVDASGSPIVFNEHKFCSKDIPRVYMPSDTQVGWNSAFCQIMRTKSSSGTLTNYVDEMANLIRRTEQLFRSFTEKWIQGKNPPNAEKWWSDLRDVVKSVDDLAYAVPIDVPSNMSIRPQDNARNDTMGTLISGALDNLIPRLNQPENIKSSACFAGSLSDQALRHQDSDIWRTTRNSPIKELQDLATRLRDVSIILHDRASEKPGTVRKNILKTARKAPRGKAISHVARRCTFVAEQRFNTLLQRIEHSLVEAGYPTTCIKQPIPELSSPFFPAQNLAVLFEINEVSTEITFAFDKVLSVVQQLVPDSRPYRIVPIVSNHVLTGLALTGSATIPLPDQDFELNWKSQLGSKIVSRESVKPLDDAVNAAYTISSLLVFRQSSNLLPDEKFALKQAFATFKCCYAEIRNLVSSGLHYWTSAFDYLHEVRRNLDDEKKQYANGSIPKSPIWKEHTQSFSLPLKGQIAELAAIRIVIFEEEARSASRRALEHD